MIVGAISIATAGVYANSMPIGIASRGYIDLGVIGDGRIATIEESRVASIQNDDRVASLSVQNRVAESPTQKRVAKINTARVVSAPNQTRIVIIVD